MITQSRTLNSCFKREYYPIIGTMALFDYKTDLMCAIIPVKIKYNPNIKYYEDSIISLNGDIDYKILDLISNDRIYEGVINFNDGSGWLKDIYCKLSKNFINLSENTISANESVVYPVTINNNGNSSREIFKKVKIKGVV